MTLPAQVLDLKNWKITLPAGSPGKPTEVQQPSLATYDGDFFKVVSRPDGPAVAFRAPVNGVTTSGSANPRSELREMSGSSLASWSSTDGKTHTLVVDEAVTHLPNPRTSGNAAVVSAQIHDASNDISVFRVEDGKVWVTRGNDTHFALADANYVLGTRFKVMFVVHDGQVDAYYNGRLITTIKAKGSGWYFKAGCYTQANSSNSKPADASNYGEVVVYSVTVAHGTPVPADQPPPPTPVPDPTPAPVPDPTPAPVSDVVMIIRHGEKPKDKNDHTLNATGRERAEKLVAFFTVAPLKAGILTPLRIWASKGKTASMRPLQTVTPLANALGLPINTVYDFEAAESTVGKALAALHGVTLASAEHSAIPGVCKQFKLSKNSPKPPKAWPSERFDLVWRFTRMNDGTWWFTQIAESVMPGDKGYVVSTAAGLYAAAKQAVGIGA